MSIKTPEEYQKIVVDLVKDLKAKGYDHDSDHPERVNPIVVALLVSPNGEIIQSYRSEAIEGDHAEYNLFMNKMLGENHEDDTLYVSLETCNHDSRLNTKSCSEIVASAKMKKVYIGCFDPDILVKGNGYAYLKRKKD